MGLILVGLDLSLTSSGIAVVESTMPTSPTFYTEGRKGKRTETFFERSQRIFELKNNICSHVPDFSHAIIEGPAYRAISSSTWDRAGLWHSVYRELLLKKCTISVVPPVNLKMWLAGHGGAGKQAMIMAAEKYSGKTMPNDDCADAYGLALMGLAHAKIIDEPLRAKALKGVQWWDSAIELWE